MIYTISLASDQFRNCQMPSKLVPPHNSANWDKNLSNWTVDLKNIGQIHNMFGNKARLIISKNPSHIEIDDLDDESRARLALNKLNNLNNQGN